MIDEAFLDRMYKEGIMADEQEIERKKKLESEQKEVEEEVLTEEKLKEQADEMLRKESFVVIRGEEQADEKRRELGIKGINLSREYKAKKEQIEGNKDLTDKTKGEKLDDLYTTYSRLIRDVINEQRDSDTAFFNTRKEKAKELLDEANRKAQRGNFSEKDMAYILYVSEHGDKNSVGELLKEFDFNPFVINLLNMRTEKLPKAERVNLIHPLEYIINQRPDRNLNGLVVAIGTSKAELNHSIESLIPVKNVPSRDSWSKYKQPKPRWGSTN